LKYAVDVLVVHDSRHDAHRQAVEMMPHGARESAGRLGIVAHVEHRQPVVKLNDLKPSRHERPGDSLGQGDGVAETGGLGGCQGEHGVLYLVTAVQIRDEFPAVPGKTGTVPVRGAGAGVLV